MNSTPRHDLFGLLRSQAEALGDASKLPPLFGPREYKPPASKVYGPPPRHHQGEDGDSHRKWVS